MKSNTKYGLIWLTLTMLLIGGILWFYTFELFPMYMLLSLALIYFLLLEAALPLSDYLKQHYQETFNELSKVRLFGTYYTTLGRNHFKELKFVFSKDDFKDPVLEKLKKEYRQACLLALTIIFSIPIIIIILIGLLLKP